MKKWLATNVRLSDDKMAVFSLYVIAACQKSVFWHSNKDDIDLDNDLCVELMLNLICYTLWSGRLMCG